jgi:hypothetical protein
MFSSVCRLIPFRFSALSNLEPSGLTSHFFLHLGLSAPGISCRITSTKSDHMRLVYSRGNFGMLFCDDFLNRCGDRWLVVDLG